MREVETCCTAEKILRVEHLNVRHAKRVLLDDVTFEVERASVTAVLGSSGAGKTTLLRSLNRLLEEEKGFETQGTIFLDGNNIFAPEYNKYRLRQCVGIIFQKPVIYPISVFKNVIFGVQHLRLAPRKAFPAIVEKYLREAFLWEEVQDRLHKSALELSVGQQQRLAIARTLAVQPQVLLMDEPTSALDKRATERIEQLILSLKREHTIVLVTHDVGQAERLSDRVLCLAVRSGVGRLVYNKVRSAFGNLKEEVERVVYAGGQ